jgi:hypothetical protein
MSGDQDQGNELQRLVGLVIRFLVRPLSRRRTREKHGLYLVFWFGAKRPSEIPTPPNAMQRPRTAGEMEAMQSLLPDDMRKRMAVYCV